MRQAIETTYKGPTNHHGSRIIARAQAGRMIIPWDYALDSRENHARAAVLYARKWGWIRHGTEIHGGALPSGGYAFVFTDGPATEAHSQGRIERIESAE